MHQLGVPWATADVVGRRLLQRGVHRRGRASLRVGLVLVVLADGGQRQTRSVVFRLLLGLVPFAQVVRQVVLDVVGKLLLVLRVQAQHFHQSAHVDAFQITIGECL